MNLIIKLFLAALIFVSCKKNVPDPDDSGVAFSNGLLVLNEGLFQNNNAGLTFYSFQENEAYQNYYLSINSENLGDVGNDLKKYGGKIYIVLNNSNLVQVLNAETGVLIQKIYLNNGSVGRSPRSISFHQNKAYVCSFDGTVAKIDTSSLHIETYLTVGRNPEDLCVSNGKLYVSNSGGLDFPNYDSTVSVVDLATFSEIKRINVGINPGAILSDAQGDVYVIRRGDYGNVSSRMFKIDSNLDSVVFELQNVDVNSMFYANDEIHYGYQNISGGTPIIGLFDTQSETVVNSNLVNISQVNTLNGLFVDYQSQRLYIFDGNNYSSTGDVYVYDFSGTLQFEFGTGYLPKKMLQID